MGKMTETLDLENLRQVIKSDYAQGTRFIQNIRELTLGAMLDPVDSIRASHAKSLNKILNGSLQRGFYAEGQLFIVIKRKGPEPLTFYVADIPKTYYGFEPKPHRFWRKR